MTTIVSAIERVDKGPVHVPQARHVEPSNTNTVGGSSREVISLSHVGSGDVYGPSTAAGERREEQGPGEAGRKDERRDGTPRPNDEDDESLRMRKKKMRQEEEAKSKLRTDGNTFRRCGVGRLIAGAMHDCIDYYCAIVNGDAGATAPRGLIMPPPDVPSLRIQDPSQQDAALGRARRTKNVAMRIIHGWIFTSSSRSNGFARAESYVAADYPTDLARAVWQSMEWSRVVSPSVVYHMLALRMGIPLWRTEVTTKRGHQNGGGASVARHAILLWP
ncbi:hypothetical protein CBR_g45460 [Chara braunii]|uniref:Uncharacterized protein n=1 Tax=Chara braunii TaxID=69332 RepID=A0A388LYR7_CHABU|nr:hypothetical protein CBR_g45460 [Chara braunii]|eukprot:GBG87403.1 hypothetical protein CBR_g45460 [Chara braunii]